jgi:predicted Fe-S protein YdhL (DUF1289 family)
MSEETPGRATGRSLAGPDPLGGSADVPVGRGAGVPSPCCSVCKMNDRSGLCEGCYRTIDEIIAWSTMADEAKRRVWQLLPARKQAAAEQAMKGSNRA